MAMESLFSPLLVSLLIIFIPIPSSQISSVVAATEMATISSSQIKQDESSLLAFKSLVTMDPRNILKNNWTAQTSVCSWFGVTCDPSHSWVTELDLSHMELSGTIPPEIGNLSSLVSLDLSSNFLHGPIPSSIFNMTSLESIVLDNNSLSGVLPKYMMCRHNKLQRLKVLRLFTNKLEGGIPLSLDECPLLEIISLGVNNLTGHVPREIGNVTQLKGLFLTSNNLRDLWAPYRGKYPEPTHEELLLIHPFLYKFNLEDDDFDQQYSHSDCRWIYLKDKLQIPNLRPILIEFLTQVRRSKGYEVDFYIDFSSVSAWESYNVFVPRNLDDQKFYDQALAATKFAIAEINARLGGKKNYEVVSVDKLVSTTTNLLLLSFTAKEIATGDHFEAFQAMVEVDDAITPFKLREWKFRPR